MNFKFTDDTPLANYTYLAGGMKVKAETGFGARHLSPALRSWIVPDPMSEKYYGISPYSYCGGNPVMFVDPDGEADYFNEKGVFIYSDGKDDGWIRITSQESFDNYYNLSNTLNDH